MSIPRPPQRRRRFSRPKWLSPAILERVLMFSVAIIALALFWSSATRFSRNRQESKSLSGQIARLSGEIDLMQAQWPAQRILEVSNRMPAANHALFQGSHGLTDWIQTVRDGAVPLALDTEFDILNLHTQALDRPVASMQTRLRLFPDRDAESPRPTFQRLLDFGQRLVEGEPRPDIVRLSVQGSSNSVSEAHAVLELLADATPSPTPKSP